MKLEQRCCAHILSCIIRTGRRTLDVKRVVPTQNSPFINLSMYDDISIFLDSHNAFGFDQDTSRELDPTHPFWIPNIALSSYRSNVSVEIAQSEVVSDHGTPTSVTLITPTGPLFDAFVFPPPLVHPTHQPFAPTDPGRISFNQDPMSPHPNANYECGVPPEANESCGREFYNRQEDAECHIKGECLTCNANPLSESKAGPMRIERSRNRRQAPYQVNEDHKESEKCYVPAGIHIRDTRV